LEALIATLRPKHLVAIGRDAQTALADLWLDATAVRHPSYGGKSEFKGRLEEFLSRSFEAQAHRSTAPSLGLRS
jgi:hypothetical protein